MQKKKVLIVEDESIIALSLKIKLESFGFEVIDIVDRGEKAIEVVTSNKPDLILMDIRLAGEMDGIETALSLRNKFDVPSIFLTAYVDDKTIERAKHAYPVGYLQKPFDDTDLKSSIEVGLFKEEMQQKLIEKDRKLETAQKIARLSHWEWDVRTNTGYLSNSGHELLQIEESYFGTRSFLEDFVALIHPKDQKNFMEMFNSKIFTSDRFSTELRIKSKAGKLRYYYMIVEVTKRDEGSPRYVKGVIQDITERKELELELLSKEKQLQESQKLEAMGRLAGVIAHDFNNYLTLLLGNLELLKRASDPKMKYYNQFSVLLDTVKYASSLTNQLLTFSRKQVVAPELLDINEQILEISELLKILTKKHNFVINLDAKEAVVLAESSQIQQIILNLVSNAVEALPYAGTIQIHTENESFEEDNHYGIPVGKYVVLHVTDNGVGMDEETKSHAFEPFYTSDTTGRHSGIGLSAVYGITKQFGGEVIISDNEETSGTEFQIILPVREKVSPDKNSEGTEVAPVKDNFQKISILVVEDNQEISELLSTILQEENNYEVQNADTAKRGFEIYQEMKGIDLVISDILLPGMSGTDFVEEIQKINPDQKILLISGFVDSIQVQNYLSPTVQFIPKPFMIDEILAKIESFF